MFLYLANNIIVSAKMDSAVLLMGKKTAIHLEIVQNKNEKGVLQRPRMDQGRSSQLPEAPENEDRVREAESW